MDVYGAVEFVHILGLIALFGGFAIFHRAGLRLREATTLREARASLDLLQTTPGMFAGGTVMLLVSGIVMAFLRWRGPFPWMATAIVGLITIAILGSVVVGRWTRSVVGSFPAAATDSVDAAPIPTELADRIRTPTPWIVAGINNGMALGIVWLMTNKPGWIVSIAVVVGLGLVGAVVANAALRRPSK